MIQALGDLHFVRPQWLWALLALVLLLAWWHRRRRRDDAWARRVDPHLLPHLLAAGSRRRSAGRTLLAAAVGALAILALAGPGWRQQEQPLWQQSAPLVIALDLSSATLADDLQPSRLLQARAAISQVLQARAGGEVALVVFAGEPHTVAPLTEDAGNVRLFLDALAPDIMPTDGSRPERAIAWSVELMEQGGFERGDVLLLTHDAGQAARRAAAAAARGGYRVSVLGLGTAAGAAYRDATGRLARTRMDAGALQSLATAGAGQFQPLEAADHAAWAQAGQGSAAAAGGRGHAAVRADQGYWLLLPLMLLAALAFRRGALLPMLALAACLPLFPGPAQAREGGLWKRADQAGHERALEAVEAYRGGDFEGAAGLWAPLPGADAAYNRGNALARAGRLQEAMDAYDEALGLEPGMEDAIANRALVEEALQRPPPAGGGGSGDEDEDGDEGESGEAGPGDDEAPADADADAAGDQMPPDQADDAGQDRDDGQDQTADASDADADADADAQREADEALREEMQRALEQSAGDEGDAPQAAGAGDLDERERREAAEAWLRRIPDDPGGLLRARFRLEHERRRRQGAD